MVVNLFVLRSAGFGLYFASLLSALAFVFIVFADMVLEATRAVREPLGAWGAIRGQPPTNALNADVGTARANRLW